MKPNPPLKKTDKKSVLLAFLAHFERELSALVQSAKAAHLAATHEESRAEDRHDTFAIEASYLAQGQAARVQDLQGAIAELRGYLESQRPFALAEPGALVTLESEGKRTVSLVTRHGGGTSVPVDGRPVTLMSLSSPVGEVLRGLREGDDFAVESKSGDREYEIVSIE